MYGTACSSLPLCPSPASRLRGTCACNGIPHSFAWRATRKAASTYLALTQALETYPQFLAYSLIGGLTAPVTVAAAGLLWCIARVKVRSRVANSPWRSSLDPSPLLLPVPLPKSLPAMFTFNPVVGLLHFFTVSPLDTRCLLRSPKPDTLITPPPNTHTVGRGLCRERSGRTVQQQVVNVHLVLPHVLSDSSGRDSAQDVGIAEGQGSKPCR